MDCARHDMRRHGMLLASLLLCLVAPRAGSADTQPMAGSPDEPAASANGFPLPAAAGMAPPTDAPPLQDGMAPGPEPGPGEATTPATGQPCRQPGSEGDAMVDMMQRGVYLGVCGAVRWFDGLFGTRRYDQDSDATYGRLGLAEVWDDRDGLRTRVRLRARIALPIARQRVKLLFGRLDDQELEQDAQLDTGTRLPSSFQRVEDDSWLLGLGYSRQGAMKNGFDFGAGIKIRTPVDPYVKGTYRHNFVFGDDITLRARQTLFWRDKRGVGETTEVSLDKLLNERMLLRWDNAATLARDLGRLEWSTGLILFQSLNDHRGLSYTGFVRGIANTEVPVRDYGVELRYRVRVLRKWLFLEGRSSLTWPRETRDEERDINPGVGLGFEMYFGPVPAGEMR